MHVAPESLRLSHLPRVARGLYLYPYRAMHITRAYTRRSASERDPPIFSADEEAYDFCGSLTMKLSTRTQALIIVESFRLSFKQYTLPYY